MSQLVQYEPAVTETVEVFLNQTDRLYAQPNKVCDFAEWLQYFAFDVSLSDSSLKNELLTFWIGHWANHVQQAPWLCRQK